MTQNGVDARLRGRLDELATHFASRYHRDPSFFVRVPGRVNLIGEHVDYCGYSVCPMAIEQDVLVAVAETEEADVLRLTNVDARYPDYRHERISEISECRLDDEDLGPSWHRYFLCGVKGALGVIPQERQPRSILAAVWGNVPPNAGLSSSSALVSAALLATVRLCECVHSEAMSMEADVRSSVCAGENAMSNISVGGLVLPPSQAQDLQRNLQLSR